MRTTRFSFLHALTLSLALATTLIATGCGNSVYHRSVAMVPGDSSDRLALRVREARNAADDAISLIQSPDGALTPVHLERADAAAWEYSRRVASVQDVLRRLPSPDLEAQKVLSELQRAESELNSAVERLAHGEPADDLLAAARLSLTTAMASADIFTDGHASAAVLPAKGRAR